MLFELFGPLPLTELFIFLLFCRSLCESKLAIQEQKRSVYFDDVDAGVGFLEFR